MGALLLLSITPLCHSSKFLVPQHRNLKDTGTPDVITENFWCQLWCQLRSEFGATWCTAENAKSRDLCPKTDLCFLHSDGTHDGTERVFWVI
jgi:hypothetical protein